MTDIENLRLNWRDEDGSAQFASPLRTAAAVYIVALETENAGYKDGAQRLIESNTRLLKRAEQAEAELAALKSAELSEHRLAREEAEAELAALKGRRWDCGIPSCGAYPKARAEEGGGP